MMNEVAISQKTINMAVQKLTEEKENIDGFITSLNTEVESISKAWEGADAVAYVKKMQVDYKTLLTEFSKCLGSYIDFLNSIYSEYDNFNKKFESRNIEV